MTREAGEWSRRGSLDRFSQSVINWLWKNQADQEKTSRGGQRKSAGDTSEGTEHFGASEDGLGSIIILTYLPPGAKSRH